MVAMSGTVMSSGDQWIGVQLLLRILLVHPGHHARLDLKTKMDVEMNAMNVVSDVTKSGKGEMQGRLNRSDSTSVSKHANAPYVITTMSSQRRGS